MKKGEEIYNFAKKIYPHNRSITGEGVRKTLYDLKEYVEKDNGPKFNIYEVASGTNVFDWTIPKEWYINEAFIEDVNGNHIIDIKNNNLHVIGYSTPVDKWVDLKELLENVYTQEDQPDAIPYVTSYYKERFGFCMSENQKKQLKEGRYHIYIDSKLFDGVLNYGEVIIPGKTKKEVFFSTYICHPSMANNECSGPSLSAELVKYVNKIKNRKYTYRFIYIPETIGSITYMSENKNLETMKKNIIAGFNLSCVGDNNNYSIVETRNANTFADKVLNNVLRFYTNDNYIRYSFLQRGSDERQYNSPGADLPVVCFCRTKFSEYKEYHTSLDNLDYISPEGFQGSYDVITQVIQAIEHNCYCKSSVIGEPQLGRRGLYPTLSKKGSYGDIEAMVNFIAYCDGEKDLLDISNTIGVSINNIIEIFDKLVDNKLINVIEQDSSI